MSKTIEAKGYVGGVKRVAKPIEVSHEAEKQMLSFSVSDWYTKVYDTDTVGLDIKPDVTFMDVVNALNARKDVYDTFGAQDSVVRERIFGEIASRLGIKYDVIYDLWLADEVVG